MALSNTFYFLDCAFIISKCFAGVNREFSTVGDLWNLFGFLVGVGVSGGGACWWSLLVVFLLCIGYFVVPFSLVEICSLGQ